MSGQLALFADLHGLPRGKIIGGGASTRSFGCASGVLTKDILGRPVLFDQWARPNGASDLTFCLDQAGVREYHGDSRVLGVESVVIGSVVDTDGSAHVFDIRGKLRDLIEGDENLNDVNVGAELEFYLHGDQIVPTEPKSLSHAYGVEGLTSHQHFIEHFSTLLDAFSIPWEHICQENESDQFEVALRHAPLLEMADRITLARLLCRIAAKRCGTQCTFAPVRSESVAPSNLHLHVSRGEEKLASIPHHSVVSDLARFTNELMTIFRPTNNGYRAGTISSFSSPDIIVARNSRFSSIRLIDGIQDRFELRVPTSECNPYLVLLFIAHLMGGNDKPCGSDDRDTSLFDDGLETLLSSVLARDVVGGDFLRAYRAIKQSEAQTFRALGGPSHEFMMLSQIL